MWAWKESLQILGQMSVTMDSAECLGIDERLSGCGLRCFSECIKNCVNIEMQRRKLGNN